MRAPPFPLGWSHVMPLLCAGPWVFSAVRLKSRRVASNSWLFAVSLLCCVSLTPALPTKGGAGERSPFASIPTISSARLCWSAAASAPLKACQKVSRSRLFRSMSSSVKRASGLISYGAYPFSRYTSLELCAVPSLRRSPASLPAHQVCQQTMLPLPNRRRSTAVTRPSLARLAVRGVGNIMKPSHIHSAYAVPCRRTTCAPASRANARTSASRLSTFKDSTLYDHTLSSSRLSRKVARCRSAHCTLSSLAFGKPSPHKCPRERRPKL